VQTLRLDRRIELHCDDAAKLWLADIGFDPQYGARPLKRAIQQHVLNALSTRLLGGAVLDGSTVRCTLNATQTGMDFEIEAPVSPKKSKSAAAAAAAAGDSDADGVAAAVIVDDDAGDVDVDDGKGEKE
jgi:hypothetical protein